MHKIVCLVLILSCMSGTAALAQETPLQRAEFLDYEAAVYQDPIMQTPGILKIKKGGVVVLEQGGYSYSLEGSFPKMGDDVTGDGTPDLVVSHWSGGAHCCYSVYIYALAEELKLIQKVDGEHGEIAFKDLNADAVPELVLNDYNFAYWHASFTTSPAPQVVLKFKDGAYAMDRRLMKRPLEEIKPPVRDEAIHDSECEAKNAWKHGEYCVTSEVWGHMLDLIYGGHPSAAWAYLDSVWGSDEAAKQQFITDFKQQLRNGTYPFLVPKEVK